MQTLLCTHYFCSFFAHRYIHLYFRNRLHVNKTPERIIICPYKVPRLLWLRTGFLLKTQPEVVTCLETPAHGVTRHVSSALVVLIIDKDLLRLTHVANQCLQYLLCFHAHLSLSHFLLSFRVSFKFELPYCAWGMSCAYLNEAQLLMGMFRNNSLWNRALPAFCHHMWLSFILTLILWICWSRCLFFDVCLL